MSPKKYGPKAQEKVKNAMHELKKGTLKSGRSGKKVTNNREVIAIGLSEARKSDAKVPHPHKLMMLEVSNTNESSYKKEVTPALFKNPIPERHQLLNTGLIFKRLFA